MVTAASDPGRARPAEIIFANGNRATLVNGLDTDANELLAVLGVQPGSAAEGAILVCGGADDLTGASLARAQEVLGRAVAASAHVTGAAVFDGGTSSGVMAITGAVRGSRPWA